MRKLVLLLLMISCIYIDGLAGLNWVVDQPHLTRLSISGKESCGVGVEVANEYIINLL